MTGFCSSRLPLIRPTSLSDCDSFADSPLRGEVHSRLSYAAVGLMLGFGVKVLRCFLGGSSDLRGSHLEPYID